MYTHIFTKNIITHVTNLVSIICCLLNFAKEILYFGVFLAGKYRSNYFVCHCQRFKDANNLQTTISDASSVVFLFGKVCRENSFLSFSPFFSCQDKPVIFLPLLSLSPSPQSLRARSFFCSPPYRATAINITFGQQKSTLCE